MMKPEQRKKLLSHLAEKAEQDTKALVALQKEAANITSTLAHEAAYGILAEQLNLLEAFWYRVPDQTLEILTTFLTRLKTFEPALEEKRLSSLYSSESLAIKALEILAGLRYFKDHASKVLDALFAYSVDPNEGVATKAQDGIKAMAAYDIEVCRQAGLAPQMQLLEKIEAFNDSVLRQHFSIIEDACQAMLSPTMQSTSWSYNKVTWHTGAVPTHKNTQEVRSRTMAVLKRLYPLAINTNEKKQIIGAMEAAATTPNKELNADQKEAFTADTVAMLEWFKGIAEVEQDMLVLQQIEHDAYWTLRRSRDLEREPIQKVALEIRDLLYANAEYGVFRVLIGFQGIFREWEKYDDRDFESEQKVREDKAIELAEEVNESTFGVWKNRILDYAQIESNDLATFPYFGKFLERIGKQQPALGLELLTNHADALERFLASILFGVIASNHKQAAYDLMQEWCNAGQHLFRLGVFFQFAEEINEDLLSSVLEKAIESPDISALSQITTAVSDQYDKGGDELINKFFMPALEELGKRDMGWCWVNGFWYQKHSYAILNAMSHQQHQVLVNNLLTIPKIDYHAEEILVPIAEKSPDLVLDFFCNRLNREEQVRNSATPQQDRYDAVPFSLGKLAEPLAVDASLVLEKILPTYDAFGYGMFIYRGASLIRNIFPRFSSELETELIGLVRAGGEKNWLSVIAILRNYEGEEFIHPVCKELVKAIPEDDELIEDIMAALQSEGVVHGEYGMAESYERKIRELEPWKEDTDSKIRTFAEKYIAQTERMASNERKRAEEDIALRKHQYGEAEE